MTIEATTVQLFDWADFGWDIHIGSNKPAGAYRYSALSRAEYHRKYTERKKNEKLKKMEQPKNHAQ